MKKYCTSCEAIAKVTTRQTVARVGGVHRENICDDCGLKFYTKEEESTKFEYLASRRYPKDV